MRAFLFFCAGFFGWYLIGAAVLAWWDMPERLNGRLLEWSKSHGMGGAGVFGCVVAWPYIARRLYRDSKGARQ